MIKCISSSNEVRVFNDREEARRFVLREGDHSKLWDLVEVSK